jgi:hypothetical protein
MAERQMTYRHEFVDFVPEELEPGVLHVSIKYKCVAHLCMCGCGEKVISRLAPERFRFTFDGGQVSIYPSIGNSTFVCRSHYWLEDGEVYWYPPLSDRQIDRARKNAHRMPRLPSARRWLESETRESDERTSSRFPDDQKGRKK